MRLGLSVVIVEDEPLLTMLLEELLEELGCKIVATASTVATGALELERHIFDIAVLDVHLRGELVWPLADQLRDAGQPFVLASGDEANALQARYPSATILSKPYELDALARALRFATSTRCDDSSIT